MSRRVKQLTVYVSLVAVFATGCAPDRPFYFFEDGDLSHYKGVATEIEYPDVYISTLAEVDGALAPLSLHNADAREIWDLTLQEAIYNALVNAKVMRNLGGRVTTPLGSTLPVDLLLNNPDFVPTIYDPAIQESDPRFGVEGALSAFDAEFTSSLFWEKRDQAQNIDPRRFGGGAFDLTSFIPQFLDQDLGTFQAQLAKTGATGGQFFLRNNTAYDYSNATSRLFPSAWNTNIEAEFRHPILQGAGVDFNRIAGPNAAPGVYNGVALARIRTDIALSEFESGVRNLVSDVETQYWALYLQYRILDAETVGRDSALQTWRRIKALADAQAAGGEKDKESQSREQYFLFRSRVEAALSDLYAAENRLRYLMGLAATDGRLIRPSDDPSTAPVVFDWVSIHGEGLARSPELRQQRWVIKQRELELVAAKNFLLPRLDVVGLYRWRGFGDKLIADGDSGRQFDNAWQNLADGDFQEYQVGLQFSTSIGYRQQLAGVRHAEQHIARARAILQDQELELSHLLTNSIRNVDRFYTLSQTNFNRRVAAEDQVEAFEALFDSGSVTVDLLLDAQRRLADADTAYYNALVSYMQSITAVHFHKGSLLEYNSVFLAEGPWPGKAYLDASEEARKRDAGAYIDYGFTRPKVFSRGPVPQGVGSGMPGEFDFGETIDVPSDGTPTPAEAAEDAEELLPPPPQPEVEGSTTSLDLREAGDGPTLAQPAGAVRRTSATLRLRENGQAEQAITRAVHAVPGQIEQTTPSRGAHSTLQFKPPQLGGASASDPAMTAHEADENNAAAGTHRSASSWTGAEH